MSTANVPYLGSKISLVSKSAIRYEGTLYSIDTKESTVALAKVRSFGTEDRPTDRPVAPMKEDYDYIIFRGADIRDIVVCQPPKPQPVLEGGLPNDPAIVQHSGVTTSASNFSAKRGSGFPDPPVFASAPPTSFAHSSAPQQSEISPVMDLLRGDGQNHRDQNSLGSPRLQLDQRGGFGDQNRAPSFYRGGRGRGSYQQRSQGGGGSRRPIGNYQPGRPSKPKETLKFEKEFDFEQANKEFKDVVAKFEKIKVDHVGVEDRQDLEEGELNEEAKDESAPFYDKTKSFFDKISCDAIESSKGNNRRPNWQAEKQLNKETFGTTGNFSSGRGFRGYQGNRGGPGGYSRNRGGYKPPNNYFNQGYYAGYNNGYGRFSRENPASLQSDRRQSTSSGYQTYQWNQQRPVGRGMYRAQRGRQWGQGNRFF